LVKAYYTVLELGSGEPHTGFCPCGSYISDPIRLVNKDTSNSGATACRTCRNLASDL